MFMSFMRSDTFKAAISDKYHIIHFHKSSDFRTMMKVISVSVLVIIGTICFLQYFVKLGFSTMERKIKTFRKFLLK